MKSNQVKQQIGRIISFCNSIGMDEEHSETSNSVYFSFNNYKIRISDHFGLPNKKCISIVISSENPKQFIVSNSNNVFVLNGLSDVKKFIQNTCRISNIFNQKDMEIRTTNIKLSSDNNKLLKENERLKKRISYYNNDDDISTFIYGLNITDKQKDSIIKQLKSFGL